MERISHVSILLTFTLLLSIRHVSGFSFSPLVGAPSPAVAGRHHHHHHHDHSVVININDKQGDRSCSSVMFMASTGGSSSSDVIVSEEEVEATSISSPPNETISKAPSLNGKIVLPVKVMAGGLKGHRVAAVYAILNSNYKRG